MFEVLLEIVAASVSVIAVGFAGWQILQSRRQAIEEFNWRKRERAVSYSVFKNPEYRDARAIVAEAFGSFGDIKKPIPISEVNEKKKEFPGLSKAMLLTISHWGRMATEIELGLIDEKAAFRYHASAMTNLFVGLKEFIAERQTKNPDGNPDFILLAERWLNLRNGKK